MAGCSALVCLLLCALAHGFPLRGEREASASPEVILPSGSAEADPSSPNRRIVITTNTLTLIISAYFFAFCLWLYYRVKTGKERSPEDDAEASTHQTLCHCGGLHRTLQCSCSRCASPSAASIEIGSIGDDEDENLYGRLILSSLPPPLPTDELSSSVDSAAAQENTTPGTNGPRAATSIEA